jgi:Myosin head (motor domain)
VFVHDCDCFNLLQLLAGAPEEWHKRLKLMPASHFHYLNTSGCTSVSDIDDADGFDSTCDAMDKANIFDKDQVTVNLVTVKRVTVIIFNSTSLLLLRRCRCYCMHAVSKPVVNCTLKLQCKCQYTTMSSTAAKWHV